MVRPQASQMWVRQAVKAKSRTLSALHRHVFVPTSSSLFSPAAFASASVMMKVGVSEVLAVSSRSRWVCVRQSPGFCSTPVADTTRSAGQVRLTS